jgi:hypothetical protein
MTATGNDEMGRDEMGHDDEGGPTVNLVLADEQASELRVVLDEALGDLSTEIADTDNSEYRVILRRRRDLISAVREQLEVG